MTTKARVFFYCLIGAIGGAICAVTMEILFNFQSLFTQYSAFYLVAGALYGLILGIFLGTAEGIVHSNRRKIVTGIIAGSIVGIIGGIVGTLLGQSLILQLASYFDYSKPILKILIKAVGWIIPALFIGMAEGIRSLSLVKILYGLLGGAIGGFFGGLFMESASILFNSITWGRFAGFIVLGLAILFFFSLLEKRFSKGVFRILNGPLKGKKMALNQRKLTLGKTEKNDFALKKYEEIERLHAVVLVRHSIVSISPFRAAYGLYVNDEKVDDSIELKYEDVIRIGNARFLYEVK